MHGTKVWWKVSKMADSTVVLMVKLMAGAKTLRTGIRMANYLNILFPGTPSQSF